MNLDEIARLFNILNSMLKDEKSASYKWKTSKYGQTNGNVFFTKGGEIIKREDEIVITLDLDKIPKDLIVSSRGDKLVFDYKNGWGKRELKTIVLPCDVEKCEKVNIERNNDIIDIKLKRVKRNDTKD